MFVKQEVGECLEEQIRQSIDSGTLMSSAAHIDD